MTVAMTPSGAGGAEHGRQLTEELQLPSMELHTRVTGAPK